MNARIIPALLEKYEPVLQERIKALAPYSPCIQIDIADGKLVRNKTLRLKEIKQLPEKLTVELHLMVRDPEELLGQCRRLKASRVIAHVEAFPQFRGLNGFIKKAAKLKLRIGLALNPETPAKIIEPYLPFLDTVLFMSVKPGFQNQRFIFSTLKKVRKFRKQHPKTDIEVDGGIKRGIAKKLARAGVNGIVIGSAIVKQKDSKAAVSVFKEEIKSV